MNESIKLEIACRYGESHLKIRTDALRFRRAGNSLGHIVTILRFQQLILLSMRFKK